MGQDSSEARSVREEERYLRDALFRGAEAALGPGSPAAAAYAHVFELWRAMLAEPPAGVLRREIEVQTTSRLLLHPETAGSVTESALLLHHTYGAPYLPGSALKGLCRSWAARAPRGPDGRLPPVRDLFGDEPNEGGEHRTAGLLDFWDALWIPPEDSGTPSPLMLDVVTPHHAAYYTKSGHPPPHPSDEPVPVHFLTVRPKTRFLVVIDAAADQGGILGPWLDWIASGLLDALEDCGLGAKTTAGYGRFAPRSGAPSGVGRPRAAAFSGTAAEATAHLSRSKGDGALRARFANGSEARAFGGPARALYAALSEETRRRLDKGKEVRVRVTAAQEGNARRIVTIRED